MLSTLRDFVNDLFSLVPTADLAAHITRAIQSSYSPLFAKLRKIRGRDRADAEKRAMRFFEDELAPMIDAHHRLVVADELGLYPPRLCVYSIDLPYDDRPRDELDILEEEEHFPIVLACLFLNLGIPADVVYTKHTEPLGDDEQDFWRVRVLVHFDDLVRFALRQ